MLNYTTSPNLYTIYDFTDDALRSAVVKIINCLSETPKAALLSLKVEN